MFDETDNLLKDIGAEPGMSSKRCSSGWSRFR
jgi:hypothetical protein